FDPNKTEAKEKRQPSFYGRAFHFHDLKLTGTPKDKDTTLVRTIVTGKDGLQLKFGSKEYASILWGKNKHFRLLPPKEGKIHLLTLATDKYAVLGTNRGLHRFLTAPGRDNDERRSTADEFRGFNGKVEGLAVSPHGGH